MAGEQPKETVIDAGTFVGSKYAQFVSVSITDIDVTLEFAFINPRDKKGQVVSRVTLPLLAGIDLAQTILTTQKMHEQKKGGSKND